ncbi:amidohydrolase family protein [Streptomyces spirodelae]|uniref:Amidohydrolase family protein n=1 Tax=Streptomyces spirodelae TaxID=2812904 RepID=A0ABS3WPP1_9ACTN|nr:amidohydrolase family protein [Streptomyces spirodelae]MBO8185086.1 amidohydrolase family protein [Streptomyces spirodelae]
MHPLDSSGPGALARGDDAPLLLVPETVLLPDGPADDHAVVVDGAEFTAVGPAARLTRDFPQLTAVRLPGTALLPGFIDAHHHLTQSFGAALAFGEPSEIFRRVWVPLENALDEESAYVAAKLASLEALRGGFTTVADAGTRAPVDVEVVASAARDAGLRCVLGQICNDAEPGAESDGSGAAEDVRARAAKHLARYAGDPLIHPSLAVSIPEAATEQTLAAMARLASEAGAVLQIHVNEHLAAVERSLVRHGLRPLEQLHRLGVLGPHLLAAHATLLTPRELTLLQDSGTAVSYNPVASAWKGNAVAPALSMAERGIRFGLGSDGTRGDAFRLLDAAETAQRLVHGLAGGDSSCGGGWTWLDHGTRLGAEAVGLDDGAAGNGVRTGVVAAGAAADFLLLDLTGPEMCPSHDLPWELVRRGNRDQISAVFTAGRLRLWHGWPLTWDGRELVRRAAELAREVVARAPVVRVHPPSTEAAQHTGRAGQPAARTGRHSRTAAGPGGSHGVPGISR